MDADSLGHDHLAKMLSPARTPDAPDENPEAKPPRKYAVENDRRLSGQAATISIIGGNPIVGRALEILLAGVGYDARLAGDFENGNRSLALDGARLLLLAPTLDGASPGTEEITALATLAKLPVLALVTYLRASATRGRSILRPLAVPHGRAGARDRRHPTALQRLNASQVPPVSGSTLQGPLDPVCAFRIRHPRHHALKNTPSKYATVYALWLMESACFPSKIPDVIRNFYVQGEINGGSGCKLER